MIEPELNHAVEFYPGANDSIPGPKPVSAIITNVYSDREVSVRVFGRTGGAWTRNNVRLLQGREQAAVGTAFAKYPDDVRKQAGELSAKDQKAVGDLAKQRLNEFLHQYLIPEIQQRKLGLGQIKQGSDTLMVVEVKASGHTVQVHVPVEMVSGDAKLSVVAGNLAHSAIKQIEDLKKDDGQIGKIIPVPPAPETTPENFGKDA